MNIHDLSVENAKLLATADRAMDRNDMFECRVQELETLLREAWPVMKAYRTRHARKALNDSLSGFWRESHQNKAVASEDWLKRAAEFDPCSALNRDSAT